MPGACARWQMRRGLGAHTLAVCDVAMKAGVVAIRVLVAFDNAYRAYREVIGAAIRVLRPQVEVTTTDLDDLEAEVARLDPQVVISSRDKPASLPPVVTWAKVPIEPGSQTSDVTLEMLLAVVDRVEKPSSPGSLRAKRGS
jgi:hypothetical protein